MDIADQASDSLDTFNREAMYLHQRKQQTVVDNTDCVHCEEHPAHVTPHGVRLKYCLRCMDELELKHL